MQETFKVEYSTDKRFSPIKYIGLYNIASITILGEISTDALSLWKIYQ